MVLEGPLTAIQLRSPHHLSELVVNGGSLPDIKPTDEIASLVGRTRVGSPTNRVIARNHTSEGYHLKLEILTALDLHPRDADLVLVSHYKKLGDDDFYITIEYYSPSSKEATK
ncbi:MAG: hypothetical protein PHF67_03710 [Candidatus Nanoarchaeia archaeon]|nr:hypothetical protein [Candidatus Nanoarchaeia archaeon]